MLYMKVNFTDSFESSKSTNKPKPVVSFPSVMKKKPKRIRVFVVDDHPVVVEGVRSFLRPYTQIEVVGVGTSGEDALIKAPKLNGFISLNKKLLLGLLPSKTLKGV